MLAKITVRPETGWPGRDRRSGMFLVDDDLKSLLESGVAVVVGTTDAELRPHVIFGWGPRLLDDRHTIQLCVETARVDRTAANLEETGTIAVTIGDPVSIRSVQFKGRHRKTSPPTPADEERVRRHRELFGSNMALIGTRRRQSGTRGWRRHWSASSSTWKRHSIRRPGPRAGLPL